jgi:hypothetical protein
MKPSDVLESYRAEIRRAVEMNRARNPRVFGSVARGEDTEASNLDLLVDAAPGGMTLFDLGQIQADLKKLLKVPVDVVTPGFLPEHIRARVQAEAVPV